MQHEILFKAIALDSKEWVEGFVVGLLDPTKLEPVYHRWMIHSGVSISAGVEVIPETICQYIGLSDDNEVKIFENDTFKETYNPIGNNREVFEYYKKGTIVYNFTEYGKRYEIDGTRILNEERKLSHHATGEKQYRHPTTHRLWTEDPYVSRISAYSSLVITGNIHDHHVTSN